MLKQAVTMAKTFSQAAATHKTVALGSHLGADKPGSSLINGGAAPMAAILATVSGMVGKDNLNAAGVKQANAADGKLPHLTDPIIGIAAKAGLGVVASQSVQVSNGEMVSLFSGQNMQFLTGAQMRVHSGQAIGVLGGAIKADESDIGLQMVAGRDDLDFQAQGDSLTVQARDEVHVRSANGHIDWAAARRISLSTAGGANITIDGGNITVQCPGMLSIHAGKKVFSGPERDHYAMPQLPRSICVACMKRSLAAAPAFTQVG
jgi:uncharacterized protein (DUF2345 family)